MLQIGYRGVAPIQNAAIPRTVPQIIARCLGTLYGRIGLLHKKYMSNKYPYPTLVVT